MNLIRNHKISLLREKPLTGVQGEIIKFIEDNLSDLIPFTCKEYSNSIYYFKNNKCLLEQDLKNNKLWCRYNGFWEVLETKYNIKYNDIQEVIKYMVERAFKQQVGTPKRHVCLSSKQVERAFKQQVGTPQVFRYP